MRSSVPLVLYPIRSGVGGGACAQCAQCAKQQRVGQQRVGVSLWPPALHFCEVACGDAHTVAIVYDADTHQCSAYTWGCNTYGQCALAAYCVSGGGGVGGGGLVGGARTRGLYSAEQVSEHTCSTRVHVEEEEVDGASAQCIAAPSAVLRWDKEPALWLGAVWRLVGTSH